MKRFLFVSLIFFLSACQKKEGIAENGGAGSLPPPPSMSPAVPNQQVAETGVPAESQHGSGAPVPFMQKLNEYKARLDKNPKDVEALVFLGNANYDIQRFEKAKEFYLQALDADPHNTHVQTDLASAYRNLGDIDKALEELDRVLKVDPKHEVALYNSGIIYLNDKNDVTKATAAWEKLIQIKPNDPLSGELKKKIAELKEGPAKQKPASGKPH